MKRIFVLLLACFMLVSCFAGCGKKTTEKKQNTSFVDSGDSVLPDKDWEGREYRIFINENEKVGNIVENDDLTDLVGYEVFARNSYLKEKYNFYVTNVEKSGNPAAVVKNLAGSGESPAELILDCIDYMKGELSSFMFRDLADLDYIDWNSKGWDQTANDGLDILGYRYICTGDANLYEKSGAIIMYYNSDMMYAITDEGEDIRQVALDGNWTMEKMYDLIKRGSVRDDTTGDISVYGLANPHNEMFFCFLTTGYGMEIIKKDQNDIPYFAFDDASAVEQTINAVDNVLKFFCNKETTYNQVYKIVAQDKKAETLFLANRALFIPDQLCNLKTWKGSNINYGFLPLPKADEDVDHYRAAYYGEYTEFFAVPYFVADPDFAAFGLQALMETSGKLTHAYVEEQCKIRGSADDVDYQLINLALDHFVYDLGAIFNWGAIKTWIFVDRYDANEAIQSIPTAGVNNFATSWAEKKDLAHKELNEFLSHFQ